MAASSVNRGMARRHSTARIADGRTHAQSRVVGFQLWPETSCTSGSAKAVTADRQLVINQRIGELPAEGIPEILDGLNVTAEQKAAAPRVIEATMLRMTAE